MPNGRLETEPSSETVTRLVAPAASVPLLSERFSHAAVRPPAQLSELAPMFTSVGSCEVGLKGPPTGPVLVSPVAGETTRLSGTSKASTTPIVPELDGEVALLPMPRFANAVHRSPRFAPALLTTSAWRIALRACKNVGFAGDRFMPSVTSCRINWFPVAEPYLAINLARASHN